MHGPPESDNRSATITLPGFPHFAGIGIFMVDDEPESIEMLRLLHEGCGAEVKVVASAAEAKVHRAACYDLGIPMSTVHLNLDEDLVGILGELQQPVDKAAVELIVLELYRMGKLSSGRASAALGMSRLAFIQHASDLGISYLRLSPDDLDSDIQVGRSL
jgi:hypothetical protein